MNEERLLKRKQRAERDRSIKQLAEILKNLGDLYFETGRFEEALQQYLEQIEACKKLKNKLDCAIAHRMAGEVHASLGNYQEALIHQTQHLEGARELENILEEQRAFATLGRTYFCFAESLTDKPENREEALKNAKKAYAKSIRLCTRLENTIREEELCTMRARLLLNLGLVREAQKELKEALEQIELAASLCREHNLTEDLHRTNIALGAFHERQSNYDLALEFYDKALHVNNSQMKADALLAKSELLLKLGEWLEARKPLVSIYIMKNLPAEVRNQAEKLLRIAVSICNAEDKLLIETKINSQQDLYENLGDAAVEVKSYDKAIDYYGKMLLCAEECHSDKVGAALISLAQTLRDAGRSVEALHYAKRELELCFEPKEVCRSILQLADLMKSARSTDSEIRDQFNLALTYAQNSNESKLEVSVLKEFLDYLEDVADIEEMENVKSRLKKLEDIIEIESEEDEPASQHIGQEICLDDLSDVEEAIRKVENVHKPKRTFKRGFVVKRNEKGETQLQSACVRGDVETVEKLLSKGHPVLVRDSFGWTPLHEAANYDFVEIAKLLIKAGAEVNDPGGPECKAMTPLLDAATNGNFSMIYCLLENGGDVDAVTTEGETVIDCLEGWRKRAGELSIDSQAEYDHCYKKLLQLMTVIPKGRRKGSLNATKRSIWVEDELSQEEAKEVEMRKSEKISAGEDYKRTIASLKHRGGLSNPSRNSKTEKVTAPLLDSEEILVGDWLEDDINSIEVPDVKRRSSEFSSNAKRSNEFSSNAKRRSNDFSSNVKRMSNEFSSNGKRTPESSVGRKSNDSTANYKRKLSLDSDISMIIDSSSRESDASFDMNESLISEQYPNKRKRSRQSSLLKIGFSKEKSSRTPSPICLDEPNYLMKQISACITMNFSVLIDYNDYNVSITFLSDRQSVLENVMEEVKSKFEKDTGCKVKLKLTTWEGVELHPEITPNFFIRTDDTIKLKGEIIDMFSPSIVDRYKNICKDCKTIIQETTIKSLKVCENSSIFRLNYKETSDEELPPLLRSLQYQKNLQSLQLTGASLFNVGNLLNITIQRLSSLYELNLQNCDIDFEVLSQIDKFPYQLRILNLSYNPLGPKSQEKIYNLLEPLKYLQTLNLRYCKLDGINFTLKNDALENLDVSWNPLGGESISRLLQRQMLGLSLSNTQSPCSSSVVSKIINNPKYSLFALENLELVSCKITDADVRRILTETPSLTRFALGGNKDVTKISVYALLKREPSLFHIDVGGCTTIVDFPSTDVTIKSPEVCNLIVSMAENVIDVWGNLWRGRGLATKLPHNIVIFKPL